MKKLIYIIVFMITVFVGYNGVKGATVIDVWDSTNSNLSGTCNSNICGSTWSKKIQYLGVGPKLPIFGVRITLLNSNGERISDSNGNYFSINFWASQKMYNAIYTGNLKDNRFSHSYSEDPNSFSYKLRFNNSYQKYNENIIKSSDFNYVKDTVKYANVMERLKNESLLKNIYDKYLNCKNPGVDSCSKDTYKRINLSFNDVIAGDYYLLVEPVFVYLAINNGNHWYVGTAYEIGYSIINDNLNSAFTKGAFKGGNTGGWGGKYYVFDNFLTALYLDKSVAGYTAVNPKSTGVSSRYWDLLNHYSSGWSKGIIYLKDYANYNLKIVKKYGTSTSNNSAYDQNAYFRLYRVSSNNKWDLYKEGKASKNGNDYILNINNIPGGDYYLCETEIPDNIKKVYFYMKKPNDGNNVYSLNLGNNTPSFMNAGDVDLRACSKKFTINGTKKQKYIFVANEKNNVSKITVIKKLGTYSADGSTYKSYPYTSYYKLYYRDGKEYKRADNGGSDGTSLAANKVEFSFSGNALKEGKYTYKLCEVKIKDEYQIEKVYFRSKNKGDGNGIYSIDLGVKDPSNACIEFDYDSKSGEKRILVLNQPKDSSKLRISKRNGTKDNSPSWYNAEVTFHVCRKDNNSCIDAVKKKGDNYVDVTGLEKGVEYYIKEDVPANTLKVSFYTKNSTDQTGQYSDSLGENIDTTSNKIATSGTFKFIGDNKTQYIMVYNDVTSECDVLLKNITDKCAGGICSADKRQEIKDDLDTLYEDFPNDNLIINYRDIDGDKLDVSQTSCASIGCKPSSDDDVNPKFTCNEGSLSYKVVKESINYESPLSNKVDLNKIYNLVCYGSKSSSTSFEKYNYVDKEGNFEAECGVTYKYSMTKFQQGNPATSGNLLWISSINKDELNSIGTLDIGIECNVLNSLSDDDELSKLTNTEKEKKKSDFKDKLKLDVDTIIKDLSPDFSITLEDDANSNDEFTFALSDGGTNMTPKYGGCDDKLICDAYWNFTLKFDVYYTEFWYLKNGLYYRESKLDSTDEYVPKGYGLPISVDAKPKIGYEATLSFGGKATDTDPHTSTCLYDVENNYNDDSRGYNFDFRIIDTNNPFPGVNGDGRLTGDNWCLSSVLGTRVKDKNNKYRLVGDITGDLIIGDQDYSRSVADYENAGLSIADVNGNGKIDYSDTVTCDVNYSSDNCIIYNYLTNKRDKICSADNNIVDKYIINRPNSNSMDTPMYSFTLNSTDIKNIREYNKSYIYNDYNYKCTDEGKECIDNFLTKWIKNGLVNNDKPVSHRLNSENSSCYETRSEGNWCNNLIILRR